MPSVSDKQQKFFKWVQSVQNGTAKKKDAPKSVLDAAKSMTKKQVSDFADHLSVKKKRKQVKENHYVYTFEEFVNEAKYNVNYACGHTGRVELFGKIKDREWRIEQMEKSNCPDCRHKAMDAHSEQKKNERGLLDLEGSPKQIAWANNIREGAYATLDILYKIVTNPNAKALVDGWKQKMDETTSAKWWIDHRYDIPSIVSESDAKTAVRMFSELFK